MTVKLQSQHHLEFLSLKGGCIGLSESTLVKMPHCWKSHVAAHFMMFIATFNDVHNKVLYIMGTFLCQKCDFKEMFV